VPPAAGVPKMVVNRTTSLGRVHSVFWRGSFFGAKPATLQSSALPGSRLTSRIRAGLPRERRIASEVRFSIVGGDGRPNDRGSLPGIVMLAEAGGMRIGSVAYDQARRPARW
jgi:hypothetical protein